MDPKATPKGIVMNRNAAAATLCVLILAGCAAGNRYELSKDNAGRVIRLDTQTGEVMLVEGNQLTTLKETTEANVKTNVKDEEIPQVEIPDGGKSWPTLTIHELGNTNAELTSYWYNGKLHYVLELYPFSKWLNLVYAGYFPNPSFTLVLNDATDKQVAWTNLSANRLQRKINKTRNAGELSAEGVITMTNEDYDRLAAWQLQWNP